MIRHTCECPPCDCYDAGDALAAVIRVLVVAGFAVWAEEATWTGWPHCNAPSRPIFRIDAENRP